MTKADDNAGASGSSDDSNAADDKLTETGIVREAPGISLDAAHNAAMSSLDDDEVADTSDDSGDTESGNDDDGAAAKKVKDDNADDAGDDDEGGADNSGGDDAAAQAAAGGDGGQDDDEQAHKGGAADEDAAAYQPGSAGIPKADDLTEPEAPTIDADITQPGDYKVEFTDMDGNKYYVSSAAQLPEDFEPKSSRDYGISLEKLSGERSKFADAERTYTQSKSEYDNKSEVRTLQEGWEQDIQRLSADKKLPEDKKERDTVVAAVYKLMGDEMTKGNVIDKFSVAHELYEARKARADAEAAAIERDKQEKADRKKRGAKVMGGGTRSGAGSGGGGGGGSSGPSGSRVLDGVRPGTTLDDVHASISHNY